MSEPWKRREVIGDAMRRVTIYALCESSSGEPRYIGKTTQTVTARYKAHVRAANRGGKLPVHYWIRKRIGAGKMPVVRNLESLPEHADWQAAERNHIEKYRAGGRLLNLTAGGEGLSGHVFSQDHKEKIATALRTGATFNCETCSKPFWRKRNEIASGDCKFCSRACYALSLKGKSKPVSSVCKARGIAAAANARRSQTHCKRGHPLSGENLFITSGGARGCKECRKIHKASYRARGAHG